MSALTVALVIAFYSSWHLTLVVMGCVPFIILTGAYQSRQIKGRAAINKKLLEGAGRVCVCEYEYVCKHVNVICSWHHKPLKMYAHYTRWE